MADNMFGPLLDPAGIQYQLERQKALYNALAQQAITPQQGQMVSGHYIAPAFGGLGAIGQALIARNIAGKIPGEQSQLSRSMADNLSRIFGGQQQQQVIQPPNPNPVPVPATPEVMNSPNLTNASANMGLANATNTQNTPPPQVIQQPSSGPDLANLMKVGMASSAFGPEAGTAVSNWMKPTEASLMASQAGLDPKATNQAFIRKQTFIDPISMRQGAALVDPLTNKVINFSPKMPDNSLPILQNGQIVGSQPLPGAQAIEQGNAYVQSAGSKGYKPSPVSNNPTVPNTAAGMPPGVPSTFGPTSEASINAFGQGQAQQLAAMDKAWTSLSDQNRTAQTTNSYLQNIKGLAPKAATGEFSAKKDFVNNLISNFVPGAQERATDAVSANDLLDKYQGQIIARLSAGGMSTDSARSLLASAYPGAHMNLQAINEAVDNLVGANEMIKAKAGLLSSYAAKRDPISYQQKEITFDQNADPRIWQYKAISDPAQKKAFAASVIKQDPQFPQKIQALESIGVIK